MSRSSLELTFALFSSPNKTFIPSGGIFVVVVVVVFTHQRRAGNGPNMKEAGLGNKPGLGLDDSGGG